MIEIINVLAILATVGFGLIGWLAPSYTMDKLDLAAKPGSTLGFSEIRAASGALFVGLGIGALVIGAPWGYAMMGFGYLGAATGRITSIIIDNSGQKVSWSFFAAESALGLWLVLANPIW